ncbi:type II toxin-antitoxin system VapC family toxin [Nostoc sp. 'Peltigera membranacea cyanobiont' 210A]|uniref:type II toxin-antitoxin system VapC family toxin n=1 Tax=unclassified Nostoc TaxID=2593658 RepID=UPI000B959B89|nr:type II toxin-antitoxin system VapC family toxin [Nostoc sp. 'Peltigera membranacea cyanobiont' 210A]MBN4002161.1 type II toxin-antitoxin system VapC family toxin [Nostoc sp. LPT]OYD90877.1 PIN domain nuclease [Nostoc sp. 'Peltigera membranacea cyanobiont' 210A]
MRALLDTHAFIWWVTNDPQLSANARNLIADSGNILFLSVVSAWEIVIKNKLGKLTLPEPVEQYIPTRLAINRFESLPIQMSHVLQVASLPNIHRDPFDRILIAQSQVENLPIVTIDQKITQYLVQTIW